MTRTMLDSDPSLYVAGHPERPNRDLAVHDVATHTECVRAPFGTAAHLESAIASAYAARRAAREVPAYERRDILRALAARCRADADALAARLVFEAGKPITAARAEVERAVLTFEIAAEEATRCAGRTYPMDLAPYAEGHRAQSQRVPIGACALITPFNFPLNLVAHKIAPAIAAGCPFVLKPAEKTPLSALAIGAMLAETSWPRAAWSIVPCRVDDADPLVRDERLALLSFTGSDHVGWMLKERAPRKRVILELGGNAACVFDDDVDLDDALPRVMAGAYGNSGQSCISVQRVLVPRAREAEIVERCAAAVRDVPYGDVHDTATVVGPLIDDDAAARVMSWIDQARRAGATVHAGGTCDGRVVAPTLLSGVPADEPLACAEAFGPVMIVQPYDDFAHALALANDSRYGLQAGVFTNRVDHLHQAWDELEVGAVVINDVPSFRVDHMPYGGVKESGIGREGPRSAIEDMTEERLLIVRDRPR